jgi:mono/diheme cytochrome c family protein
MFDFLGVTVLVSLAALGTWLALRARRTGNRVGRWIGLVLSSLLATISILAVGVALIGFGKLNFPPRRPAVTDLKVVGSPEQVARGTRFGELCAACHSPDGNLPLTGQDFFNEGPPFGTLFAPNLTPAGEIRDWSDGEVVRAIREGVHKSGRALIIMPSEVLRNLSDDDVQAIVAYLRSQPAAGAISPPARLNVLAAVLIGAGIGQTSAQQPITHAIVAPTAGVSADYGEYLVSVMFCRQCHGEKLEGRKPGGLGPPAGPNLTLLLPQWSLEDFRKTLRTGVDPYRHTLKEGMPWKKLSAFASDQDLEAIYTYLHGLTPIAGPRK